MQTSYGYLNVGRKYVSQEKFIKLSLILKLHVNFFLLNTEKEYFSRFLQFVVVYWTERWLYFLLLSSKPVWPREWQEDMCEKQKCSHIILLVEST